MRTIKLSAGDNIEARCTRCRKVLNHTIVAMVGERVVRVECNTCRGMHNYHEVVAAKTPAIRKTATASVKAKKKSGDDDREEWETLRLTIESGKAAPYDMNGKFRVNTLVEHAVFGRGVVKTVIKPNKMEVLFSEGKKLLRCQ
ncbi:MAG: hypothetical protein HYS23_11365 [Geobacter sp.]|nr:hypothetical protein [Geobacter sp.]